MHAFLTQFGLPKLHQRESRFNETWNGGMVERWNTGMVERAINDPIPLVLVGQCNCMGVDTVYNVGGA